MSCLFRIRLENRAAFSIVFKWCDVSQTASVTKAECPKPCMLLIVLSSRSLAQDLPLVIGGCLSFQMGHSRQAFYRHATRQTEFLSANPEGYYIRWILASSNYYNQAACTASSSMHSVMECISRVAEHQRRTCWSTSTWRAQWLPCLADSQSTPDLSCCHPPHKGISCKFPYCRGLRVTDRKIRQLACLELHAGFMSPWACYHRSIPFQHAFTEAQTVS